MLSFVSSCVVVVVVGFDGRSSHTYIPMHDSRRIHCTPLNEERRIGYVNYKDQKQPVASRVGQAVTTIIPGLRCKNDRRLIDGCQFKLLRVLYVYCVS